MGVSCFSTVQNESKHVNIETIPPPIPNTKTVPQSTSSPSPVHKHNKKHSLSSIDESGPIIINQSEYHGPVLTEKALKQHDMQHQCGLDSISLSSLSSTECEDDILKQIGHQLISMNINQDIKSNDEQNISVKGRQLDESDEKHQNEKNEIKSTKVSNRKYKQYKHRKSCIHKMNKNENKNKNDHYRKYSISSSETPIPNDYNIMNDELNASNLPKYDRIASNSHNPAADQLNGPNIFRRNNDDHTMSESDDSPGAGFDNLQFPDVMDFNKHRKDSTRSTQL